MTADEILKRLVDAQDYARTHRAESLYKDLLRVDEIANDARAYLAAAEKRVYAEGHVQFFKGDLDDVDRWYVEDERGDLEGFQVRIPVPAHLLTPEILEGEVIE